MDPKGDRGASGAGGSTGPAGPPGYPVPHGSTGSFVSYHIAPGYSWASWWVYFVTDKYDTHPTFRPEKVHLWVQQVQELISITKYLIKAESHVHVHQSNAHRLCGEPDTT